MFNKIKKKYLNKSSFIMNVTTLTTGELIGYGILIITSPILTRLYNPPDFGIYSLYMAITTIFSVIATGRYEFAIMLPKKEKDALSIFVLCLIIVTGITLLVLIIITSFKRLIVEFFKNKSIGRLLYFTCLTIFFIGIYNTLSFWLNRKKSYNKLAFLRISQITSAILLQIGLGFSKLNNIGLILGNIGGYGISSICVFQNILKKYKKNLKLIAKKDIIKNARKYINFPKINSFQALIDSLRVNGEVFLISYFFGKEQLGLYFLTLKVLKTPSVFIGSAVSRVFFQRASLAYNKKKEDLQKLIKKLLVGLFIISSPIFLIIIFFGPTIFKIIFNKKWELAGVYARILSPWIFFNFITSPISTIPFIFNKQKELFFFSIIGNFIIFGSLFYAGYFLHNIKIGFYLISLLMSLYFIFVIRWIYKISELRK